MTKELFDGDVTNHYAVPETVLDVVNVFTALTNAGLMFHPDDSAAECFLSSFGDELTRLDDIMDAAHRLHPDPSLLSLTLFESQMSNGGTAVATADVLVMFRLTVSGSLTDEQIAYVVGAAGVQFDEPVLSDDDDGEPTFGAILSTSVTVSRVIA